MNSHMFSAIVSVALLVFAGYCASLGPGPGVVFALIAISLVGMLIGFEQLYSESDENATDRTEIETESQEAKPGA